MTALPLLSRDQSADKVIRKRCRWSALRKSVRRAKSAVRRGYYSVASGVEQGQARVRNAKKSVDVCISQTTGITFEWCDATATAVGAAGAVVSRHRVRQWAEWRLHDAPGHWKVFRAVNAAIDSARGRNHRIQWGHSIECLPALVQQFGWVAVPAYAVHLAQDFTTTDGIPLIPFARFAKIGLQKCGLKATTATSVVTVNAASVIGAVSTAFIVIEIAGLGYKLYLKAVECRGAHATSISDAVEVGSAAVSAAGAIEP